MTPLGQLEQQIRTRFGKECVLSLGFGSLVYVHAYRSAAKFAECKSFARGSGVSLDRAIEDLVEDMEPL